MGRVCPGCQHYATRRLMLARAFTDPALGALMDQVRWASDAQRSVSCCVRDIAQMRAGRGDGAAPAPAAGDGPPLVHFHGAWPCCFVTVVATVTAVGAHADRVSYTLDDGSDAVDVTVSAAMLAHASANRGVDGIPSCYVRPALRGVPAPPPAFLVGDVVRCVGRIRERAGGRRWLHAHTIAAVDECTAEPRHVLRALELARTHYRTPPAIPHVAAGSGPPCRAALWPHGARAPTTAEFRDFLRRFLEDETTAYIRRETRMAHCPTLSAVRVPTYTVSTLRSSAVVRDMADGVISRKRARQPAGKQVSDSAMDRLLSSVLRTLERDGVLIVHETERTGGRESAFQVLCPHLVATYISALLRLGYDSSAECTSAEMRDRLQSADARLAGVGQGVVDAALGYMEWWRKGGSEGEG
ncbi:hypothetical protein MSPP1_000604 [Malassezia sp. CBS 17886]|nr:hypothetical protein MSPP1_000604 [Malassezia sp. CBS 17886]